MLPWSVSGKIQCIQKFRWTALEYALIFSPKVWVVKLLQAILNAKIKLVVYAWDWEIVTKNAVEYISSSFSLPKRVFHVKSWPDAQRITSRCNSIRDCSGNHWIEPAESNLMLGNGIIYGRQVKKYQMLWQIL